MRKHKALGVNALPEEIEAIDKRRNELGLSRAKYLTTLAKVDIQHELLVAETTISGGMIVNLVEPRKPIVRIDRKEMEEWGEELIENAIRRISAQIPGLQGLTTRDSKSRTRS